MSARVRPRLWQQLRPGLILPVMAVASAAGLAAFGIAADAPKPVPQPAPDLDRVALTVTPPSSVDVGRHITIDVDGAQPGMPLHVILDAGYGPVSRTLIPTSEDGDYQLSAMTVAGSGTVLLVATQGDRTVTSTFELVPGDPVDPIPVYLGGRTVVAEPRNSVMVVAVPNDHLGNPVADGTPVGYSVVREEQQSETATAATEHLLSDLEIKASTEAGMVRVGVESGTATGAERTFLQVAGRPVPFLIDVAGPVPLADGHSLLPIETEVIVDRHGNILPDGVIAYLEAGGAAGIRRQPSMVIDGRVRFDFEAPPTPGLVRLQVVVAGVRSEAHLVEIEPAVDGFPVSARRTDDGLVVDIGRVRSTRGSYVPDGTEAVVEAGDHLQVVPLIDGFASVAWETGSGVDADSVVVTLLGHREVATVYR